ncbi:hypothetical protein COOONC_10193 [Cooperia oncophora]
MKKEKAQASSTVDLANHCSGFHSENGSRVDLRITPYSCKSSRTNRGTRHLGVGKWQVRCNRAGKNPNTATVRVRTRKDNTFCPCFLNVEYCNNDMVTVKGCFGHAGHEVDPALLRLSTEEQEYSKMPLEDHTINYITQRVGKGHREKNSRLFLLPETISEIS